MTTDYRTVLDLIEKGVLDNRPNVHMIRGEGVRIVQGSIPREVRKELRQGVKDGLLVHLEKDGFMPECYCHPNSKWEAIRQRNRIAQNSINALRSVYISGELPEI